MKVLLKVNIETLAAINDVVQEIYNIKPTSKVMENVKRSIGFELAEKINTKCRAAVKKHNNLFDGGEKISLSLKYYEAWALKEILVDFIAVSETDFNKILTQKTIALIDQKLR